MRFTEEPVDLVYMGPMTERMQERVIEKFRPLKAKIQAAIDRGTVFLFTGNALEVSATTSKTRTAAASNASACTACLQSAT